MKEYLFTICALVLAIAFFSLILRAISPLWDKDAIQRFPSSEEKEIMSWAFGENWRILQREEYDTAWNKRHDDIFIAYGTDEVFEFFVKVKKSYFDQKAYYPKEYNERIPLQILP